MHDVMLGSSVDTVNGVGRSGASVVLVLAGHMVAVCSVLQFHSLGEDRRYYNVTVHPYKTQTQAYPLSIYD